jgi:hypothetical protein
VTLGRFHIETSSEPGILARQLEAGVDVVTDGEHRRADLRALRPCRTPLLDHERVSAPHAAGGLVHEEEHLGLDARGRDPHLRPLVLFLADPEGALGISM